MIVYSHTIEVECSIICTIEYLTLVCTSISKDCEYACSLSKRAATPVCNCIVPWGSHFYLHNLVCNNCYLVTDTMDLQAAMQV